MGRKTANTASSMIKIIGLPFALVGLLLLGLCIFFIYNDSTFDEKYVMVSAEIVDIYSHRDSDGDTDHTVYVSYEYEGELYPNVRLNYYTSSMRIGKSVDVYINPDSPAKLHFKAGMVVYISLGIMGAMFSAVGFGLLIVAFRGSIKNRLVDREQGELVYATVASMGDANFSVNGARTYRITATWDDPDGITHDFKSEYLFFDPSGYIKEGEHIRVYVDPKNYKKYYMCAAELQLEDPDYQQYSEY